MEDPAPLVKRTLAVAALLALGAVVFTCGWWVGRETARGPVPVSVSVPDDPSPTASRAADLELGVRLGRIERELESLRASVSSLEIASAPPGPLGPDPKRVYEIAVGGSPTYGLDDAAVTIVEFSDFECPFCASARGVLDRIVAEYPETVRIVFKHHPLPSHENARLAHHAAIAADEQGKFWEMHERLFDAQDRLDRESLIAMARELDLDVARFVAVLGSPGAESIIERDQDEGRRLHLMGVPSFFVAGRFVAGAQPFEVFRERIEAALRAN